MREFASAVSRAGALPAPAKLVYTAFAFFTLAGLAGSVLLYGDMVGAGARGVVEYYYGTADTAPSPSVSDSATAGVVGTAGAGPTLDLDTDDPAATAGAAVSGAPPGRRIVVAAPYRKLLEVTHFHLFSMPVLLLVVGHLFMLTGAGPRAKTAWIGTATAATALHLFAPWGVHAAGTAFAWLYPVSGAMLLGTYGWMLCAAVWDMWRPRLSRPESPASPSS